MYNTFLMEINMFNFSVNDLDKSVQDFFGPNRTLEDFGISEEEYRRVEEIDSQFSEGLEINETSVIVYGFESTDVLKTAYVKSHMYNAYRYSNDTIKGSMEWRYNKAKRFVPLDFINAPPTTGNLFEYLSTYSIPQFVSIGW